VSTSSLSIHAPSPTQLSPLSLHDALPIYRVERRTDTRGGRESVGVVHEHVGIVILTQPLAVELREMHECRGPFERNVTEVRGTRSEEHTSELQSPYDLVCRLLLEKKKKKK